MSAQEKRIEALREAGFGDWGEGMWHRFLHGTHEDASVVYTNDDETWDDRKIGVRIPVTHFANVFQRPDDLEAQVRHLFGLMRSAIDNCEVCREESGARRCARCQTFADEIAKGVAGHLRDGAAPRRS